MRMTLYLCAAVLLVTLECARADCYFYFADQRANGHFHTVLGMNLNMEATYDGSTPCQLSAAQLVLGVADGKAVHYAIAHPTWQTGHLYTVRGVINPDGSFQLLLDNQSVATGKGSFAPAPVPLLASEIPSFGSSPAAYSVSQVSLQAANGSTDITIPPAGNSDRPVALRLFAPMAPLQGAFTADVKQAVTLTATFRIDPMPATLRQLDPYVDRYGQSAYGDWPGKVKSDADLMATIAEEQSWLNSHPPVLQGLDAFGGSTVAGWKEAATGYFHLAFHNNRWWLISPLGNPSFYLAVSSVGTGYEAGFTPVNGRESMFAELPPKDGAFAPAWIVDKYGEGNGTSYFDFHIANLIRKYSAAWQDKKASLLSQRLASYGFVGAGKFANSAPANVPQIPVLVVDHRFVPIIVRHPDIFDPNVRALLGADLAAQILGANTRNPYIVGWSVGNEYDEQITTQETQAMLALGATVPAKQALVDYALDALYGGDLGALSASWKISAATLANAYAASPKPPDQDVEALRQFFARNYYATVYQTVKSIDPNHLFIGPWLTTSIFGGRSRLTGGLVNGDDWRMQAAYCDIIGVDTYTGVFATSQLDALIRETAKPIFVGEFSYPGFYDGTRGFGNDAKPVYTASDAEAGDRYSKYLQDAIASPYAVGIAWFSYINQPISGRGPGVGPGLVIGEEAAYGLNDVNDRPKYDLVERMRAANLAALKSLGLQ